MPHQIEQILAVAPVVDAEGRLEADGMGVLAQQARTNGMEGTDQVSRAGARVAPKAAAMMRSARRSISAAARREKVSSRMRPGSAPLTVKCATQCAKVWVLPEPAPAMTSNGPAMFAPFVATPCSTARRCSGFKVSR